MELIRDIQSSSRQFKRPVLALGNFDGVHCGHQAILRRLVAAARCQGGEAVVMSFAPHPEAVLRPGSGLKILSSVRDKVELIQSAGVDLLLLQRFTRRFAAVSARDFFQCYLVERIGVVKLVVGYRVGFGRDRKGDSRLLEELGRQAGVEVEIVGPITVEGCEVSSSAIRKSLAAGELSLAAKLLGRSHSVSGRVGHGKSRGAVLGFPTANMRVHKGLIVPEGVYAVRVEFNGKLLGGIANLGRNPTFGGHEKLLEVHILDFSGDLYGRRLKVYFAAYLRKETTFPDAEALARQISHDAARARRILAARS